LAETNAACKGWAFTTNKMQTVLGGRNKEAEMNGSQTQTPPHGFVLCADDYAMSPGICAGILTLLDAKAISATGAMTNSPFWHEAARDLAPFAGRADLGLHFNLTCGSPLSPAPNLAPQGHFPALGTLLQRFHRGKIPPGEIEAELNAQLDAFETAMGRPPDFIDGHQHVHAMPGIAMLVITMLDQRYPARGPYLRDPSDGLRAILSRRAQSLKALAVAGLGRRFGVLARKAGFKTNQGFSGFSSFESSRDFAADFSRALIALGPKPLVMCHPGLVDDALRGLDPAVESRAVELAFFRSSRFSDLCAAAGLSPRRFCDV
jgi:chitin disaccharide deacetylase